MNSYNRLSESDVRLIFDSIHKQKSLPAHLQYRVVPFGGTTRLSPPSYAYEEGLYLILRSQKTNQRQALQIPPHLKSRVMDDLPAADCPWSLSGPQFTNPRPASVQQRYCYPKGDDEDYSDRMGGILWTAYDSDGNEDLEYRLLHVYFSAKRAGELLVSTPIKTPTSKKRRHDANALKPRRNDVLCIKNNSQGCSTRGSRPNRPRKLKLHNLLNEKSAAHLGINLDDRSPNTAQLIVKAVRQQSPDPGRFLEFDVRSKLWYEIGDDKAIEYINSVLDSSNSVPEKD